MSTDELERSVVKGINNRLSPFQRNIHRAEVQMKKQAVAVPNRLVLMLDCSGSMNEVEQGKKKIVHLCDAVTAFIESCNWADTSLAINTFPPRGDESLDNLCILKAFHIVRVQSLIAWGGTPLAPCLERVLEQIPLTRGVVVSDGEAPNYADCITAADRYKVAEVSLDCVHIGASERGEGLLKAIASKTGGLYVKFDNLQSFARSFKLLTPASRFILTNGNAAALGAKELK